MLATTIWEQIRILCLPVTNQQSYSPCVLPFQEDLKDCMKYQNLGKGLISASQIWGTIPARAKTQRKPQRYWKVTGLLLCKWNLGKWFQCKVVTCRHNTFQDSKVAHIFREITSAIQQ